jgi:hypothetical protein
MMREIKFRAWNRDSKQMVEISEVFLLEFEKKGRWFVRVQGGDLYCNYQNGDLMQFTGLLDKNGKEIYEGDFLRYENHAYDPSEGDAPWAYQPVEWKLLAWVVGENVLSDYAPDEIEIIGNIYENPDLLKS